MMKTAGKTIPIIGTNNTGSQAAAKSPVMIKPRVVLRILESPCWAFPIQGFLAK
jgi:hypothetical protein